jgi:hypothetical protein
VLEGTGQWMFLSGRDASHPARKSALKPAPAQPPQRLDGTVCRPCLGTDKKVLLLETTLE